MTTADVSAELDRARRRVAELEAAQALRVRAERVQEALYRIAELASAAGDLQEFYGAVHAVVGELMPATNFFICLYDEARQLISWPYYVDELDDDIPDPNRWEAFGSGDARGTTAYVLRTGEPQLVTYSRAIELAEQGEIEIVGATAEDSSWVGVPLKDEGRTVGVLVVQSYAKDVQYSDKDTELLAFVGQHVGAALSRARAIEETRQRNAELALINSVQEALAGELELQAIYDVVGDRIRAVFDAQVVDIGIFHEASGLIHFPYALERGVRYPDEPIELIGFRKHAMETRQPLLVNENVAEASEHYGNPLVLTGDPPKSGLFVPLVSGGRATGVMSLQNIDREHAFSESDVQLLETLSRSLSVALENARLVHETRQRNAELALINGVQTAIAGELDAQAIYDLVGDRIREVFDAQVVSISTYSDETRLMAFPYVIERDERLEQEPIPLIGFRKHVIETLEPLLLVEKVDEAADRYGNPYVLSGEPVKSAVFVPLAAGRKAIGVVSLQNVDREHAFSEADLRLLVTLCGSLGVALDNARLVSETQQRNAELALINSVQDSIAGELDQQAIYDLVGEKLREVFAAQVVDIAVHDEDAGLLRFVYQFERGVHYPNVTLGVVGFRKHVIETREPLAVLEDMDAALVEYGNPEVVVGEPSHGSAIFQPLVVGGRAKGVISIQNLDREHAFSPSDQQLLATIAGSLGVALENAQLVNETRRRVAELATVNSVGQALATQLELDALIELVGERVRETFTADIAYVALHDEAAGKIDFAYYFESGERRPEPPLEYGLGLTSQILESREPLLLNREREYDRLSPVGTPSRSYLGVPIMAGERAIGAISVQSTSEEGRFTDPDARLLATIASNVGVAIQNARLFAEIDRQKQHFESLVEISPVAVVVLDADEHVTGWNPAAAELFGHTAEEAIGREIDDLVFGGATTDEGRALTREALAEGRAQRITRRRRKDGTPVDVELMFVPLAVDGARVGFLAIYHDITELQLAREEAEAATQAKSAFLATMSHEIRTPMNAVIGMTGLLLGTELTDEQREFAEIVRSSGDALLHVIDDVLDYSKIEAGKLELESEPFELRECVEGALEIVAPRAWEKTIELGCLIDEAAPAGIVGDAGRLRQVLLNLLSNAVKFTEVGEVVVHVDAEPAGANAYRLRFAVRDTGIGIPKGRMDTLFESFSQVDASTTRRYGGTGLGLAISRRLVELMGGTMRAESEEGKGSTFQIELSVEAAELPTRRAEHDALPQLAGKRVLVVDDNATNREIVARHVRSWGMEPVPAETPAEAVARIERGERFDVAVLDMMMPDMDGVDLARAIRRHRDEHELPLVLLTSFGRLPQLATEFAVQLAKPVKGSQLYNALLRALAEHAPEPKAAAQQRERVEHATSPLRILLAEDNAVNQKVALRLLTQLGYGADVVWNGREALEALERQRYDVVLMDVQMPELDGLDASRRICGRWPAGERPHIIAMTANAMPEDREICFAAGMNDYVAKPIRPGELAQALKRAPMLGDAAEQGGDEPDVSLDAGALDSLRGFGGDDFLAELIGTFLNDAPSLLATLRDSLERQDVEELRRAAHTLKSNGQTFGAEQFGEVCRELEDRARNGELDGATEVVDRIDREYGRLERALAALRSQPS